MKVLFTSVPAVGHLIPLLSLARAAHAAGDDVVILAAGELRPLVGDLAFRELPPGIEGLLARNQELTSDDVMGFQIDDPADRFLASTIAMFSSTRVDTSFDEAVRITAEEAPDLVVVDRGDYLGPVVASHFGIPWLFVDHSPATPVDSLLEEAMQTAASGLGVTVTPQIATVRQWPEWLGATQEWPGESIDAQAGTFGETTVDPGTPTPDVRPGPVVLVTLGTVVDDLDLLRAAVEAVRGAGATAIVSTGLLPVETPAEFDDEQVRVHPFTPIAQLLEGADAVVAAGGSGTTLAALSRGLPIAFVPRIANQPIVAATVEQVGAGVVCADVTELPDAVTAILQDERLRRKAAEAARRLGERPSPDAAWSTVRDLVPAG